MTEIRTVSTRNAPTVGFSTGTAAPLSQALVHGDTVYCSGTGPLDPQTREVVGEDFAVQAKQTLENLIAVVEAAGGSRDTVLKCTCYVRDIADFPSFNAVYREFFDGAARFPARTTVIATPHRNGVRVEVDCIAAVLR